jgi:hypothetical protein
LSYLGEGEGEGGALMVEIAENSISASIVWGVKVQRRCPFDRMSTLIFSKEL